MVQDEVKELKSTKNRKEMNAIRKLEKKKGIVIRPVDKGIWLF